MKNVPNYMEKMYDHTREGLATMLNNPELWSDTIIKRTLERTGSQGFDINDVKNIIKEYNTVLSDVIQKGETFK